MMRSAMQRAARCGSSLAVANPAMVWAGLENVRSPALSKLPTNEAELPGLREKVKEQRKEIAAAKSGPELFASKQFASVAEMMEYYEEMMLPMHKIRDEIYNTWVDRCGINSKIVQTKNASSSDMSSWKGEYQTLDDHIKALESQKAEYVSKMFNTEMFNTILNTLRQADAPGCKQMATTVFHDMTENEVAFDDATKLLLKNIMFGDSIHDNSDLLFSHIEYPERGHHTYVASETLEQIADRVLGTVGDRHGLITSNSEDELQRDSVFLLRPSTTVGAEEA